MKQSTHQGLHSLVHLYPCSHSNARMELQHHVHPYYFSRHDRGTTHPGPTVWFKSRRHSGRASIRSSAASDLATSDRTLCIPYSTRESSSAMETSITRWRAAFPDTVADQQCMLSTQPLLAVTCLTSPHNKHIRRWSTRGPWPDSTCGIDVTG